MLSNFGNRKSDKDDAAEAAAAAPPPAASPAAPPAQAAAPRPAQAAPRADRAVVSMIGPDLQIIGNLVSKGEVHIEGEVQGDVLGTHVLIGERAQITGSVSGEEVVVRGRVMGSVRSKKVALQATSYVEGDIFHKSLAIEQGAFFEGKSRRTEDPTATPARGETPVAVAQPATPPANPMPAAAAPNGVATG